MARGDTARLYHQLSSYSYVPGIDWPLPIDHALVRQDFIPNHLPTFPLHRKAYPGSLRSVELPATWPPVAAPAIEVLAGRHTPVARPLDLPGLARILHLAAGVVRVAVRRDGRRFLFRPAGSAGGLFPLELYVAAHGVHGLTDGVHWYDPVDHALRQVGPPPGGEATTLVVTGIPWRTGWRYAERGFRHLYWDAGTMLSHALALAESGGLQPRLTTRFPDASVARLVGADGRQEFPLALVTLGNGAPAIMPGGKATAGRIDAAAIEFPLVTLAQHAGDVERLGTPWPAAPPLAGELPASDDLDTVILRRGSARRLDAKAAVDVRTLEIVLAASLRETRVVHFVAVHAVEGLEPGLYRWPDLERPLRRGSLRDELWVACYEQDLGRDASFVLISAVDLAGLDDRGYREAQLDAGMVEGRLHLAAYALGLGASGMTFLDSEIPALVGEALGGLLFTCVGVPIHPTKPAGAPRAPTDVSEGVGSRDVGSGLANRKLSPFPGRDSSAGGGDHPLPEGSGSVAPSGQAAMQTLLPARSARIQAAGAPDASTIRPPAPSAAARRASTCSWATDTSTCMACRSGLAVSSSCIQTVDPLPRGSTPLSSERGA
jgi:hypothetical protein